MNQVVDFSSLVFFWCDILNLINEFLTIYCLDLNYRHRNAQMAGRASVELHTLIYFRKRYVT